jgi:hypothetical protein
MKKSIGLVIVLLVLFGGLLYFKWSDKAVTYITVSVNPELEIGLNANNVVVEVVNLNEDADILTSDLDIIGLELEEALDLIVDANIETGYIDEYSEENGIIVAVVNDNEEDRLELEEKVMSRLKSHLELRKVSSVLAAVKLSDELKAEATTYEISNGKMLLVEKAVTVNPELEKATLVNLSIKEIQGYIKEEVIERREQFEITKEELKVKKEELKEQRNDKVEAFKEQIKEKISNYETMTNEEKQTAIDNGLNDLKERASTNLAIVKSRIEAYVESGEYNSVKENVVENIREIIRKKGN